MNSKNVGFKSDKCWIKRLDGINDVRVIEIRLIDIIYSEIIYVQGNGLK